MNGVTRTYGGRRGASGTTLDYRDLLQTVDNTSTIKNLKQLKRGIVASYATWSNQSQRSTRRTRKKLVKKVNQKDESSSLAESLSVPPAETCLTPDKSLHVKRSPDPFDILCSETRKTWQDRKNKDNFDEISSEQTGYTWSCKDELKNHPRVNLTPDESAYVFEDCKENNGNGYNTSGKNNLTKSDSLYTCDMKKYRLQVEAATSNREQRLSDSINNVVNNATFLKALVGRKSSGRKGSPNKSQLNNTKTPVKQNALLTSTPYLLKQKKNYSMNVSPIGHNESKVLPSSITYISPLQSKALNEDHTEENLSPLYSARHNEVNVEVTCISPVHSKSSDKDYEEINKESVNEESEFKIDENSESPIKSHPDVFVNDEPFLGFSDSCDQPNYLPEIYDKVLHKIDNDGNKENTELDSGDRSNSSCSEPESESFETCSSDHTTDEESEIERNQPLVVLERLNDSLLSKYYDDMKKINDSYSSSGNESNQLESNDEKFFDDYDEEASVNDKYHKDPSTSLSNNLGVNFLATMQKIDLNTDDNSECISISSDSNHTEVDPDSQSCTSKTSSGTSNQSSNSCNSLNQKTLKIENDYITSFITTKRGNDFINDSVTILDDSSLSDCNGEDTILTCEVNVTQNPEDVRNVSKKVKTDLKKTDGNYRKEKLLLENKFEQPTANLAQANIMEPQIRPSIILLPGKKWERSLSIYRRQTMINESKLYRDSLISNDGESAIGIVHSNDSVYEWKNGVNPRRSTIKFIKESGTGSRESFSLSTVHDDIGFLSDECDETVCLSRLSLSESPHDVTVVEKPRENGARELLLHRCNQQQVLPFHECYPDSVLKNCHKIGEGVYGEVYLYRGHDGRPRVMKVVPVEGHLLVNGERQKTYQEVITEVIIAMELSALRARIAEIEKHCDEEGEINELDLSTVQNATSTFNEVLAVRLVQGSYPARLVDLWELYDESKGSDNDNPESLPSDQQYMVLELSDAGKDLESFLFTCAEQAYSVFYQIAFALAVAEEAYQFEHRDLHWGNVLLQPTEKKFERYVLRGRVHSVPCRGVRATIIDYTLSRVSLALPSGEQVALYNDLAHDDALFDAAGDYQFEVYRHMRDKTHNNWETFEPYTNVLWLHYIIDKMITALRYKRTNTKIHKHYIAKLKGIKNRLLDYGSCIQFVLIDNEH